MQVSLPFRQIHMDFHTSEHITGIGSRFNPEEFADTLHKANVNSVTCFARCHHGWIYFDTQKFPERRHPHLEQNLLKEQIDACHAKGIRVPIYVTVQWDHYTATQHPDWLALTEDGRIKGTPPYEAGFYRFLCVNSPYLDFLKAHVQEIFEMLPVDGLFFDIVQPLDDSSIWTRRRIEAAGQDASNVTVREQFGLQIINDFKQEMTHFVRQYSPHCTIFYNSGHIGPRHRGVADAYSHFEIESLPSGAWGYSHFPIASRYARTLGQPVLGMTGKFHTAWGDFHSFKNQAALEFECFQMLTQGAACSIGDQLHPDGEMCQTTYTLVGAVYKLVAAKEPWCANARPLAEIGVISPETFTGERVPAASAGVMKMLQEGAHQFDFIDPNADFTLYLVLILPDEIPVEPELEQKLREYVEAGGNLILSYHSGLNGSAFASDLFGVECVGEAPFSPDFVVPEGQLGTGLSHTEYVMYLRGLEVKPLPESQVLMSVITPYFNRDYRHFCSHRHTPSSREVGYPAVVQKGRVIYFAHPIFQQYEANAPHWCRQLFLNALSMFLSQPLLKHTGPTTLVATVHEQKNEARHIIHLLHYIPIRRGQEFDIIEDVISLHNTKLAFRVTNPVKSIELVPQRQALPFEVENSYVIVTIPSIVGHEMLSIEYV